VSPKHGNSVVIRTGLVGEEGRCGEITASALISSTCADRIPHARGLFEDCSPYPCGACTRYVAELGGCVVGYIDFDSPARRVVRLFVEGDHQGLGIGSALLAAAEAVIDGVVSLTTLAVNDRALSWYMRRGYRINGGNLQESWAGGPVVWIDLEKRVAPGPSTGSPEANVLIR
jgi:GNAT superfamily N-acetyltransferase